MCRESVYSYHCRHRHSCDENVTWASGDSGTPRYASREVTASCFDARLLTMTSTRARYFSERSELADA
jgi:hypothetical protein